MIKIFVIFTLSIILNGCAMIRAMGGLDHYIPDGRGGFYFIPGGAK